MQLETREQIADDALALARIATELAALTDQWFEPDATVDTEQALLLVQRALARCVAMQAALVQSE